MLAGVLITFEPDPFAAINRRAQEAMFDFLSVDLDLAFTFLQTAIIEAGIDPAYCEVALQKARSALHSTRGFQERIEDPDERQRILSRADKLEAALNEFHPPVAAA